MMALPWASSDEEYRRLTLRLGIERHERHCIEGRNQGINLGVARGLLGDDDDVAMGLDPGIAD